MAKKDILEGFISDLDMDQKKHDRPSLKDYVPIPTKKNEDIFGDIQQGSMASLKETKREIDELIEERLRLTKEITNDVDKIISQINTMNLSVNISDPTAMMEKLNLLKKKAELEEMKVNEKLNCWRDIADLKKELREWSKELMEKESEKNMLDKILEE
ncbi:MAG: hypothetical protein PHE43_00640 [Candidatus Nanoarchaeia archaeon]|nr:hypothetical protein [Candidatus Nanoarchaeia archaeon]